MAAEKSQNVQDVFLNHVRKSKTPVTVFLVNGVKLQGIVTWFDNFSVLLRRDGQSQLIYKHAIAQIATSRALRQDDDATREKDSEQTESDKPEVAPSETAPTAVVEKQKPSSVDGGKTKPAPVKETFNSLDLSKIKLAQIAPSETPSK